MRKQWHVQSFLISLGPQEYAMRGRRKSGKAVEQRAKINKHKWSTNRRNNNNASNNNKRPAQLMRQANQVKAQAATAG